MIIMSFKTTSHVEVMYNGHHLHQLAYIGDSKLSSFYNKWIEMISNMKASDVPSDDSLRDTLYRKLDGNAEIMKMDLNRYDSANEGDPEHILQFLMNMMKRHIEKGQEKSMLKAKEKALQQYINYGDKKATPSEPEPKDPKPKGPKAKPKSEPKPKASAPSKQADPPPAAPVYPSPSPTRFPLLISSLSGKYSGRATGWVKMWYLCVFKRKSCFFINPTTTTPQPHNPTTPQPQPKPHNPTTPQQQQPHNPTAPPQQPHNPTKPQTHKAAKPQTHPQTHKMTSPWNLADRTSKWMAPSWRPVSMASFRFGLCADHWVPWHQCPRSLLCRWRWLCRFCNRRLSWGRWTNRRSNAGLLPLKSTKWRSKQWKSRWLSSKRSWRRWSQCKMDELLYQTSAQLKVLMPLYLSSKNSLMPIGQQCVGNDHTGDHGSRRKSLNAVGRIRYLHPSRARGGSVQALIVGEKKLLCTVLPT